MSDVKRRSGHRSAVTKLIKQIELLLKDVVLDENALKGNSDELLRQKEILLKFDDDIQGNIDDDELLRDIQEASDYSTTINTCLAKVKGGIVSSTPGLLKDEAAQLIAGLSMTNANYTEAILLLKDTYGKPQRIREAHLHAILDMKISGETSSDLSKFRAEYECHLRGLKSVNVKIEDEHFVIATILLRKLSSKIRNNINRAKKAPDWNMQLLREAIVEEIEHLKSQECTNKPIVKKSTVNEEKELTEDSLNLNRSTAGSFNVATSGKFIYKCCFCEGSHKVHECIKFSTVNERKNRIAELNLCFNCLKNSHHVSVCSSWSRCRICGGKHHTVLCWKTEENIKENAVNISTSITYSGENSFNRNVILPTAMLPIQTNIGVKEVRALFDQGSQRTFILKDTVEKLKLLSVGQIKLRIDGFNTARAVKTYDIVKFKIVSQVGRINLDAVVVDSVLRCISIPGIGALVEKLSAQGIILADKKISGNGIDNIELLIGADQYFNIVSGRTEENGIQLIQSKLGNMLVGTISNGKQNPVGTTIMHIATHQVDDYVHLQEDDLSRLWSLDAIGITDKSLSESEAVAVKKFEESLQFDGFQYITRLPWKEKHGELPCNYFLSKKRMRSTIEKLKKEPKHLDLYDEIIQDQLQRGLIEEVSENKIQSSGNKIHYLPHHSVKKDSSTTPIRIVFDCSSKASKGVSSLNDCLYSGPSLVQDLTQILIRFRLHPYACVGDIAKAYLMIGLDSSDRDVTRFLWPKDPYDYGSKIIVYRFKVVLFGATCSQFLLMATIRHHLRQYSETIAKTIVRNLYIDNLQLVSSQEEELRDLYVTSKEVMKKAGLSLRQWSSNSKSLKNEILNNNNGSNNMENVNVLGLSWNTNEDSLSFAAKVTSRSGYTKRKILKTVASVFDPLGFFMPVLIRTRMFMQTLWQLKLDWDEELNAELVLKWEIIMEDVKKIINFKFSRKMDLNTSDVEIHAFGDASTKAFGAMVYLVSNKTVNLCISKARVAPLKCETIPQLELIAANMAARLINYVKEALATEVTFTAVHLWTDSQVVLNWIETSKPLKTFIMNQVTEIKKLVPEGEWPYLSTEDNPSDILSRGVTYKEFISSDILSSGPPWLLRKELWKREGIALDSALVATRVIAESSIINVALIEIKRFSSLKKLLRVTALVFRFKNMFISLLQREKNSIIKFENDTEITLSEIENAEIWWVRQMQEEVYAEELSYLRNPKRVKTPDRVKQLQLIMVDKVIRCSGRLQNSELDYNAKYPYLLATRHKHTELIIYDCHKRILHGGTNDTIAAIREKWWIPCARQRVRTVLRRCVTCRRIQVRPYQPPDAPPLPSMRIKETRSFEITGVDYTGALLVKRGVKEEKCYIALFTCSSSRAIHLELADDLSSQSFLRAFRRFVGRRGIPRLLISDNAKNFVSSAKQLREICDNLSVSSCLQDKRCEWQFIPAKAPWFGGMWERLIGLTKSTIKKILGRAFVTEEEMRTLIIEVEARLNDRPLTHTSDDINDPQPLTPSHLLCGYRLTTLPAPISEDKEDKTYKNHSLLTRRQKRCNELITKFWQRWKNEYVTSLREHHQAHGKQNSAVDVGHVVLIHDDGPRLYWRLG